MKWFSGLEKIVERDVPLAKYTWFRLGGPAEFFVRPQNVDELQDVVCRCRENSVPIYVLGCGANLLVADSGVKGVVIYLRQGDFMDMNFSTPEHAVIGAGAEMGKVVVQCVRKGLSGLEALTGIPGSIGGCIRMNAGGAFGDIGSAVENVTVMTGEGEIFKRTRADLTFGYRSTNIVA
ncbi:MAG TPA: FAD-binding protein, partial [Phycisphaerae bacterium]|nr:FAD-binding protein [Phycisphaerae bacterium]